jgi:Tol biopolymer transport system component
LVAAALFLGVLLAGCGGDGGSSPGPSGGQTTALAAPGDGYLILSRLNEIIERDIDTGATRAIITTTVASEYFLDPAASRDGGRIAFIRQPPATIVDGRFDGGSDLWVVNRDGSGAKPLFEHVQPNQLIRFPRWESENRVLVIVQEISQEADATRVVYTLQRIDVDSGERTRVIDDVLAFDVSPDGQHIVYAKLLPQTGEVLAGAGIDGDGDSELIGLEQALAPFGYPRYAPDGKKVAFASADQTGARGAGVRYVTAVRGADGLFQPAPVTVAVDGLPQDIWTVDASGGAAVRVADLKEDLPSLTWDGSGERIYAIGVSGLYDINLRTGAVTPIGEGAYHAQISWAP